MRSQNVLVYASELAAAIGRNKYKQPWAVFESMWRRLDEQQYQESVAASGIVESTSVKQVVKNAQAVIAAATEQVDVTSTTTTVSTLAASTVASVQQAVKQQIDHVWQESPHVAKRVKLCKTAEDVKSLLQVNAEQAEEKKAKLAEKARTLAEKATAAQGAACDTSAAEHARVAAEKAQAAKAKATKAAEAAAAVKQQVKVTVELVQKQAELESKAVSEVQCKFGTVREAASREQVQQSGHARDIVHDNKFHILWLEPLLPVSHQRWGIGGRLDGLDADGRVVEIKNRARHFFAHIPDYEYVQVQAYMHMLDASETLLVQQLNGQQRTCIILRCTSEWTDTIVPAIYNFVALLDLFVDDESYLMRAEWVRNNDAGKQRLLERWLQNDQREQDLSEDE